MPFAIIASNETVDINGKMVRARQYPWGVIIIEDANSSDFLALRTMLIKTHMEDLKEHLSEMYEQFRADKIVERNSHLDAGRMEKELQAHEAKMAKMKAEMLAVFQQKVADKEAKLKASEAEVSIFLYPSFRLDANFYMI